MALVWVAHSGSGCFVVERGLVFIKQGRGDHLHLGKGFLPFSLRVFRALFGLLHAVSPLIIL